MMDNATLCPRVYVIGDSISIQYGPYLKAYLSGFMEYARKEGEAEARLNLDVPQGANGGDSGMVLAFLKAMDATTGIDADFLLLNCGLHDIKTNPVSMARQVDIETYEKNLAEILRTVSTMRCRPIWVRTTPCDENIHNTVNRTFWRFKADCDAYNRVADRVMEQAGVPVIDLFTFTRNLGGDLFCDHVHFREPVREKQAAFLAGWLLGHVSRI